MDLQNNSSDLFLPAVITENDISTWKSQAGVCYNFPRRYLSILRPGIQVVYYNGELKNKRFASLRQTREPHYFGCATVGRVEIDSNNPKNHFFCEIENYIEFDKPVLARLQGRFLETIPIDRINNYWRHGTRQISFDIYENILSLAQVDIFHNSLIERSNDELETKLIYEDGTPRMVWSTRYERNPRLRRLAVQAHGVICMACKFDFGVVYGTHGQDYIHVHHCKPISTTSTIRYVDPKLDMVVLCANCHAMVHRRKARLLSLAELKEILQSK
jgi:predicted HNH restriction endonuclease